MYKNIDRDLRFYFITDDDTRLSLLTPIEQVKLAVLFGATIVQYRNKFFDLSFYDEVKNICLICKNANIPFIINDDVLLARAVGADGVHLGQCDESTVLARKILGKKAIIGFSVSTFREFKKSNIECCDYLGVGPVFNTTTKLDCNLGCGLEVLNIISQQSSLPVVAIGGIDRSNARLCISHGAVGVAVISCITRSKNSYESVKELSLMINN